MNRKNNSTLVARYSLVRKIYSIVAILMSLFLFHLASPMGTEKSSGVFQFWVNIVLLVFCGFTVYYSILRFLSFYSLSGSLLTFHFGIVKFTKTIDLSQIHRIDGNLDSEFLSIVVEDSNGVQVKISPDILRANPRFKKAVAIWIHQRNHHRQGFRTLYVKLKKEKIKILFLIGGPYLAFSLVANIKDVSLPFRYEMKEVEAKLNVSRNFLSIEYSFKGQTQAKKIRKPLLYNLFNKTFSDKPIEVRILVAENDPSLVTSLPPLGGWWSWLMEFIMQLSGTIYILIWVISHVFRRGSSSAEPS